MQDWTDSNSQIIAPSQLSDLANVSEAGAHDNRLVPMLLVVVENGLHALDTGVLFRREFLLHRCLVPVHDTADKRRDEESAGFGGSDGLRKGEHEGQVAIDAMLRLEGVGRFDAFPGRGQFDKNTRFVDTDGFIELHVVSCSFREPCGGLNCTYFDNVKSFFDRGFSVE